jgi:hypothetical protein
MNKLIKNTLLAVSLGMFILGLTFPIGARIYNSFLAYGILFFSWPAWAVGTISSAIVGWNVWHQRAFYPLTFRWAWLLYLANVLAIVVTLLFPSEFPC